MTARAAALLLCVLAACGSVDLRGARSPNAVDVAVSGGSSCAVLDDGSVWCWGADQGLAGLGPPERCVQIHGEVVWCRTRPAPVPGLRDAVAVAVAEGHACARSRIGEVWCWGDNRHGELGDGTTRQRSAPVRVVGLGDARDVVCGDNHCCARTGAGRVLCWGDDANRQLARGAREGGQGAARPIEVVQAQGARLVVAGGVTTCAVRADRTVACWGYSFDDGAGRPSDLPALVGSELVAILHTSVCAVAPAGLRCVERPADAAVAVMADLPRFVQIDAGVPGAIARAADGRVFHFLGPGHAPREVGAWRGATDVAAADFHACAVLRGRVWCSGQNPYGQLGGGRVRFAER